MSAPPPLNFVYDASHSLMVPVRKGLADRAYVDGEMYRLAVVEERSSTSHAHYFAAIRAAFDNLPEQIAERFPTEDALRKYCLIKAGYCDVKEFICNSNAEAHRFATFLRGTDQYALVTVTLRAIQVFTAKSQSSRAMDRATFQRSKEAVLEQLALMLGVSQASLRENAGAAA